MKKLLKIGFVQRSIVLSRLLLCPGDTGDMTVSVQGLVCHNTEEGNEEEETGDESSCEI